MRFVGKLALVSLVAFFACSDGVQTGTGGTASGGFGAGGAGNGGAGSGGAPSCDALSSDDPQPVTITILNQTAATIYLDTDCGSFVRVDGESTERTRCGDYLDGEYCSSGASDCYPDFPTSIDDGASHEVIWDGLLAGDALPLEQACRPENVCGEMSTVTSCEPGIGAADGAHAVTVQYLLADNGTGSPSATAEAEMTLPTASFTVTLMP